MVRISRRLQRIREGVDRNKFYSLDEAVLLVQERAVAHFNETIEIAVQLGLDVRHADQMVRGFVRLPHGTGRLVRVAVFARGEKAEEAKAAGADLVGAEDLFQMINDGNIDFDRCLAVPDMMPLVGRLGKILGPRGMMPNPKVGTVSTEIASAVAASKGGAVEFRVEKNAIIHAGIGKVSFGSKKIVENVYAFLDAVIKAKPTGAKGEYMNRVSIASTMGIGLKVDVASISHVGKGF
ncbi:MAG: large subunit ribosomal protein L1 [Candidatus Tokpelaia sp. JSC161]|jgi:large subunit ribosomal protein L1|nr:MAG: large subunit ribosomal protein L1 [Candidatus Tokpelaia sp. JSC161]